MYISVDTLDHSIDIKKIIITLHKEYDISSFFIDEVHFIKNYRKLFKELHEGKKILLEIGCRSKGHSQFKGLKYYQKINLYYGVDRYYHGSDYKIPLHLHLLGYC
ncbi:MAG: hypothetical protein N3F66_03130 [Spirochaetes bacterium]|nr:hypothetical protein [Spirochaetota bacterium]